MTLIFHIGVPMWVAKTTILYASLCIRDQFCLKTLSSQIFGNLKYILKLLIEFY